MALAVPAGAEGIELGERDRALLAGEEGEARQKAMDILVRLAALQHAERFIDITRAHIDGCIYTGTAVLRFAELLAGMGGEFAVPTTTNVISVDRRRWREQGIPADWAGNASRLADAYLRLGAAPTYTCAPYQGLDPPQVGEHIAWAESNAIAFANGALGARTNRYGDLVDACAALTGRVPLSGYHLDEPRRGTVVFELDDLAALDDAFFPTLGYHLGARTGDRVPVITGLGVAPSPDDLKAFSAAAATSGAVGMYHIVGVTPEAPTLAAALGGGSPAARHRVMRAALAETWSALTTAADGRVDCICFGSPHLSLDECRGLAELVGGDRAARGVDVVLTTNRLVHEAAERLGVAATLERFGARFLTDTCVLNTPTLPRTAGTLMTNSAKYAHYAPGILGRDVVFGSTQDCVRSAVAGRSVVARPAWADA